MYIDLAVNGTQICYAALCLNGIPLVRATYLGFVGNLVFVDQQGSSDPQYAGLGSRYLLYYITLEDL